MRRRRREVRVELPRFGREFDSELRRHERREAVREDHAVSKTESDEHAPHLPQPALMSAEINRASTSMAPIRASRSRMKAALGGTACSRRVPAMGTSGTTNGVDAQCDQRPAHLENGVRAIAEPRDHVRADLTASERRDRGRERAHVVRDRNLRFAGHRTRAHVGFDRFEMHAERIDARRAQTLEPREIVRRLALRLDRQIDRRFDRRGTLAEHRRAAIRTVRRAGREHRMFHAVEFDRGFGDGR